LLIVVLIMGIVLGMTGSLLGGFYNMFQASEDQSSARMRAQAVFNILSGPIRNAGIGIPSNDIYGYSVFTFNRKPTDGDVVKFGMDEWDKPIYIFPGHDVSEGNQLRVIYGVPTGLKYAGDEFATGELPYKEVEIIVPNPEQEDRPVNFTRRIGNKSVLTTTGESKIDPYEITTQSNTKNNGATSSLVAFPGTDMMPAMVTRIKASAEGAGFYDLDFYTKPLPYVPPNSDDFTFRINNANKIMRNHDIFLLRGAWAYVDNDSTFCFLNIYDHDTFNGVTTPPSASDPGFSGFMIEGIAGIRFTTEPDAANKWRSVRVDVLAEGDTMDENRDSASSAAIFSKWRDGYGYTTLKEGMFYEEFSKVFRPRNIQR
jgi:hypothetical protein